MVLRELYCFGTKTHYVRLDLSNSSQQKCLTLLLVNSEENYRTNVRVLSP